VEGAFIAARRQSGLGTKVFLPWKFSNALEADPCRGWAGLSVTLLAARKRGPPGLRRGAAWEAGIVGSWSAYHVPRTCPELKVCLTCRTVPETGVRLTL
jgi:hypothetical protein